MEGTVYRSAMAPVFFVTGLAFFSLGLAVLLEGRRRSDLALARSLPLLAGFALLQAGAEWLEIPAFASPDPGWLGVARLVLFVASAALLAWFGAGLLTRLQGSRWIRWLPLVLLTGWAAAIAWQPHGVPATGWPVDAAACVRCHGTAVPGGDAGLPLTLEPDVWARYLMLLPASALAAWALWQQGRRLASLGLPEGRRDASLTAAAFAVNGVAAGVVVPPAPLVPTLLFNYDTFLTTFGVPPHLLRALAAVAIAVLSVRALRVFETEQRRRVAAREAAVVLEERERLARELHDELGQVFGYLNVKMKVLADALHGLRPDAPEPIVAEMHGAVQDAARDLRQSIGGLRSGGRLDESLQPFLRRFRDQCHTAVSVEIADDLDLAPTTEAQLVRIVQEALTNVRKHARAAHAAVRAARAGGSVEVTIEDDGVGFDPRVSDSGYGLATMRERGSGVGATVEIRSQPGRGSRVTVRLPAGAEEASRDSRTRRRRSHPVPAGGGEPAWGLAGDRSGRGGG